MINTYPGIFNDAIGPVMRGPSSSHTAGSYRIGQIIRDLCDGSVKQVLFQFHPKGSLATTYETQGSDIGLATGLLNLEITDSRMVDALTLAKEAGIDIRFEIVDYPAFHPNTYQCQIENGLGQTIHLTAISTGGGLIEVVELNGIHFNRAMDFPIIFIEGAQSDLDEQIKAWHKEPFWTNHIIEYEVLAGEFHALAVISFRSRSGASALKQKMLKERSGYFVQDVYPVTGYSGGDLPFHSALEIEHSKVLSDKVLCDLAIAYETARSGISKDQVLDKMSELVDIFRAAIETGLSGTEYDDRIVGAQSPAFEKARSGNKLLPSGPLDKITAYIMAIMESKSAMEVIIAAPTAGAAGGLPGTLIGMAEELESSHEELINAFLAAGLIGVFINQQATFAAEVAGCQAETGAGAAMAAAGLIQLSGGHTKQAFGAASLALQNIMGLVCDPIGNRVEIPCLGRNVQAGGNALISANMILGGVDPVIPLSEAIETMLAVGQAMPRTLRCTALGGLASTPTAKRIEEELKNRKNANPE